MIGSRTILLLVIGLLLLVTGAALDLMVDQDVSVWIQLFIAAFGAYVIGAAYFAWKFDQRRALALESGVPVKATFKVQKQFDGDTASLAAIVKTGGEDWLVPLKSTRRSRAMLRDGILEGEAWRDEKGRIVALAFEGEQLKVMPFPNRMRRKRK